jgi:hypothetical protein
MKCIWSFLNEKIYLEFVGALLAGVARRIKRNLQECQPDQTIRTPHDEQTNNQQIYCSEKETAGREG